MPPMMCELFKSLKFLRAISVVLIFQLIAPGFAYPLAVQSMFKPVDAPVAETSYKAVVAFENLNHIVAQALQLQISKHTLKDQLVQQIGRDLLEGFDLENIEEIRDKETIREFSIFYKTRDGTEYRLTYSFEKNETTKISIPIGDKDNVYVRMSKVHFVTPTAEKLSVAQSLDLEFKKRFPDNHEMMLAMFGEFVMADPVIKRFFDKIMKFQKKVLSPNRALYLVSLLRMEKDFASDEYVLSYYAEGEDGGTALKTISYDQLDDEFLKWALGRNVLLKDLSSAYSLYLEKKKEIRKTHGEKTRIKIQAGQETGKKLYEELMSIRPKARKDKRVIYKGDVVNVNELRWLDLSGSQGVQRCFSGYDIDPDDIRLGIHENTRRKEYDLYVFTKNREFTSQAGKLVNRPFKGWVPIAYAILQHDNDGVPLINACQARFFLPHEEGNPWLSRYIQGGLRILYSAIEGNIQDIVKQDVPVEKIRLLTASTHLLANVKMAEHTAQHYYLNIPKELGYSLVALKEPILLGGFRKINFIFEKKIWVKDEENDDKKALGNNLIESERVQAIRFMDEVKLMASKEKEATIVALGTNWIKGYKEGPYSRELNQLIVDMRKFCEKRGISFIDREDENLLGAISLEKSKEGKENAKVVVIANKGTVVSNDFMGLENVLLYGVDNRNLDINGYICLVEILRTALGLSQGRDVGQESGGVTIDKCNGYYLLTPNADVMNYDSDFDVRLLYKTQLSA